MKFKSTYLALAVLAGFGLALGACSSSSDDPPQMATPPANGDTMPPAPMSYPVALPAEMPMEYTAPTAGMLTVAAGGMMDSGDVTFSCPAGGMDCEITIADDGTVTSTGAQATAALTATAMARLEGEKLTMMTEADGRAAGLHEALTRSEGANDIFGVGASALSITPVRIPQAGFTAGANTDIIVTRGLTGDVMVTRDRAHWHGDATAAASLGAAGWGGQVLEHDNGRQMITVHSNIANAVRADFEADVVSSVYRPGLASAGDIPHLPTATTDGTAGGPVGTNGLTLPVADMRDAAAQGLLDPGFFPGPGATGSRTLTYTYADNPAPGPRNYEKVLRGATFHGASGTYTCTEAEGTNCTIDVTPANAAGPATYAVTGAWRFTPDREATVGNDAQLHLQDSNWLSFGWWLDTPAAARPGGAYLYNAQVFYGGANQYNFASIASLPRLNLTYEGPAGGLYARMANETTGVTSAQGEFSADATLTARYGLGDAGTATADVTGTITNFANSDGVDMSGWRLNLARTAVATIDTPATGAGSGAVDTGAGGVTSGDANNRAGRWEFQLYGPNRAGEYPSGVAGRFFAAVDGNTAVAGAFGAE
jgi:hypothetical protein